jgi:hypothetical protein
MVSSTRKGIAFSDQDLEQRGNPRQRAVSRHLLAEQPDQHQQRRLHDTDDTEHDELGEQVGAGRQSGRAFPDVDRAFLDQLPDRARGPGQAGADGQHQQQFFCVLVVVETRQAGA